MNLTAIEHGNGAGQRGHEPSVRARELRLRIEPSGPTGPTWLTLLAVIGWMRGVVVWDGVEPYDGVAP